MKPTRSQEDRDDELIFHRKEWRIQRVGWVLVALFLAFALGGLFGSGPLSRAHADGAAGRVEYERFLRYGSSTDLVITPAGAAHGVSRIEIDTEYLEAFRVEHITPEPAAVRMTGRRLLYEFSRAAPGASISFSIRPQRLWSHRAAISIDGGAPLEISQLTYP
jgi:hypothetical protein